jgi:hypothetical protein
MVQSTVRVWEEFVEEFELKDSKCVRVTPGTLESVGPAGIVDFILGELDKVQVTVK